MASIHYDKDVLSWLRSHKIQFIERADNCPNCPQVRPIKIFWANVKKMYSQESKVCDSLKKFAKKWSALSDTVARISGHAIMSTVRRRLREVSRNGAFAPLTHTN